jgi:hypothetical protein
MMVARVREGVVGGREGAMHGVEVVHPLPCNTAAPLPWISPEASGSRSCSMDLTRGRGEGCRIYRYWGFPMGEDAGRWCTAEGIRVGAEQDIQELILLGEPCFFR